MIIKEASSDLHTSNGPMRTCVFYPAAPGKYPGVVLFSEIFQVTGPIRRTAALLAGHGFVVAVPEIFHELEEIGRVLPYDQAGADRGNKDKTTKKLESYDEDSRVLLEYLKERADCSGKLGCVGICIGGHLSFRCAMNPQVRAAVCFYATDIHKRGLGLGTNDNSLDRIPEIKGELLMFWGKQDPHIPPEGRALIYQKLSAAGTVFSWHEFNGQHAFLRDEGPRYDAALAMNCYRMALDLFYRKLGEGDLNVEQIDPATAEGRH